MSKRTAKEVRASLLKRALILDNDIYLGKLLEPFIKGKVSKLGPWLYSTHITRVKGNSELCHYHYKVLNRVDMFNFLEQKFKNERVRPDRRPRRR